MSVSSTSSFPSPSTASCNSSHTEGCAGAEPGHQRVKVVQSSQHKWLMQSIKIQYNMTRHDMKACVTFSTLWMKVWVRLIHLNFENEEDQKSMRLWSERRRTREKTRWSDESNDVTVRLADTYEPLRVKGQEEEEKWKGKTKRNNKRARLEHQWRSFKG